MPAQAQDAWYKPVVPTGLTEPRYVRAIEMRPGTVTGRKITHHALARLQQDGRVRHGRRGGAGRRPAVPASSWNGPSASRARSCAPNSGKLMLPGSNIVWDIHYHAVR